MDNRSRRLLLGKHSDKFNGHTVLPNYYNHNLFIPIQIQKNIEYLAHIAYPSQSSNRETLIDAFQIAIIRLRKNPNFSRKTVLEDNTTNREWDRVDSCIRKGTRKIIKALILWQVYEDFTAALDLDKVKFFSFEQYMVRNLAFYAQREKKHIESLKSGEVSDKKLSKLANIFQNVKTDFELLKYHNLRHSKGSRTDAREAVKPYLRDFKEVKKVIHLIYGLYESMRGLGYTEIPHILVCSYDLNWINKAIKISQYKLSEIIIKNNRSKKEDNRIVEIPIKDIVFFDIENDPLFLRKSEFF